MYKHVLPQNTFVFVHWLFFDASAPMSCIHFGFRIFTQSCLPFKGDFGVFVQRLGIDDFQILYCEAC